MPYPMNCIQIDQQCPCGKLRTLDFTSKSNLFVLRGKDSAGQMQVIAQWRPEDVKSVYKREQIDGEEGSIEIYLKNGQKILLDFFDGQSLLNENEKKLGEQDGLILNDYLNKLVDLDTNKMRKKLNEAKLNCNGVLRAMLAGNSKIENFVGIKSRDKLLKQYAKQWREGKLSNYEYLLKVNLASGRSFNDPSHYPIFPWILSNYDWTQLDLNARNNYRDLSKPICATSVNLSRTANDQYKNTQNMVDEENLFSLMCGAYNWGTYISSSAKTYYYLIRRQPYTQQAIYLQDGAFDKPDRLLFSVGIAYNNSFQLISGIAELIPEFYSSPEILRNQDRRNFGIRQNNERVDDILTPNGANTPENFIEMHKKALESDYVSEHLQEWIDLNFGLKQQDPESVNAYCNFTKESINNVLLFDTEKREKSALLIQMHEFGRQPHKLFPKKSPQRKLNEISPLHQLLAKKPLKVLGKVDADSVLVKYNFKTHKYDLKYIDSTSVKYIKSLTAKEIRTIKDYREKTLLHVAVVAGDIKLSKQLLDDGFDIEIRDIQGKTALQLATENGQEQVVTFLLGQGAHVNYVDHNGDSALHLAARKLNQLLVKYQTYSDGLLVLTGNEVTSLLDEIDKYTYTAKKLVQNGANCMAQNLAQLTPLHELCNYVAPVMKNEKDKNGQEYPKLSELLCSEKFVTTELLEAFGSTHLLLLTQQPDYTNAQVDLLIGNGANVNITDTQRRTPLHFICQNNNPSEGIITSLLEHGANINAQDKNGQTPLHLLCQGTLQQEIIDFMLESGSDLTVKDRFGRTPLYYHYHNKANLPLIQSLTARSDINLPPEIIPLLAGTKSNLLNSKNITFDFVIKQQIKNGLDFATPITPINGGKKQSLWKHFNKFKPPYAIFRWISGDADADTSERKAYYLMKLYQKYTPDEFKNDRVTRSKYGRAIMQLVNKELDKKVELKDIEGKINRRDVALQVEKNSVHGLLKVYEERKTDSFEVVLRRLDNEKDIKDNYKWRVNQYRKLRDTLLDLQINAEKRLDDFIQQTDITLDLGSNENDVKTIKLINADLTTVSAWKGVDRYLTWLRYQGFRADKELQHQSNDNATQERIENTIANLKQTMTRLNKLKKDVDCHESKIEKLKLKLQLGKKAVEQSKNKKRIINLPEERRRDAHVSCERYPSLHF